MSLLVLFVESHDYNVFLLIESVAQRTNCVFSFPTPIGLLDLFVFGIKSLFTTHEIDHEDHTDDIDHIDNLDHDLDHIYHIDHIDHIDHIYHIDHIDHLYLVVWCCCCLCR